MRTQNLLMAALATHSLSGCSLLFEEGSASDGGNASQFDARLLDGAILDSSPQDAIPPDAACTGNCPNSYARGYSCLCYIAYATPATFGDARQACRTPTGGNLVIIDTAEKNAFVQSFIALTVNAQAWIGLDHIGPSGEWKWVDNSPLGDYHAFSAVDPPAPAVPRCANMIFDQWVDRDCSEAFAYVCQAPAS